VLFGAATLLLFFLQGFVLQFLSVFGVTPFLYPVLVAVLAMWEGPLSGSVYGLVLGVLCDLAFPSSIPCFYTLIFPVVGLASAFLTQTWLHAGALCSIVVSALAFFLTDFFHCAVLALSGHAAWAAGGLLALKETCLTLVFLPAVYLLLWRVHLKCHVGD